MRWTRKARGPRPPALVLHRVVAVGVHSDVMHCVARVRAVTPQRVGGRLLRKNGGGISGSGCASLVACQCHPTCYERAYLSTSRARVHVCTFLVVLVMHARLLASDCCGVYLDDQIKYGAGLT